MISRKHATRILALLLAVLLFGQLAAFQLPVSAASAVPAGHDGAAYIPAGADVNDLLSQTLLSNYDEVGSQQWEYRATSTLSDYAVKWTPVNGFDTTGNFFRDRLNASYPALDSESAAQSYTVRIEGTSTVYTFTKLASPAADAAAPSVTPDAAPGADPAVTPDTDTAPDTALSTAAGTAEDEPGTYTLNMTYTADGKIDFDALRAAIVSAVLPGTDVSDVTVATIKENSLSLPGVEIVQTSTRSYEQGDIVPAVLGRVGKITAEKWKVTDENGQVTYPLRDKGYNMNDVLGISGLESAYEDELRGKDGVETITRNSDGVIVNTQLTTVPEPGHTVQLTINSDFQRAVNKALANNIDMINRTYNTGNMKAAAGAAVVIDVKNGGVLAASNYPSFDQNLYATQYDEYSADPSLPLFNRSLQGLYTPGSTFKPAVAVAALDSGLINQYSTVNCTGVYTYYKDYRPRCTQHGHRGNISVVDAIKWSCNIFFYDVGRRLTSDVYDAYAYKLGLAQRTGVEVSESLGRLTTKNDSNYNTSLDIQAAIGQGNTVVTPIQLATYAATLANNGVRYRTHFVKAILDTNTGEVIHETQPEVMDVVEDNGTTFALVRQGMKLVPSTITGKISSYPIAIACKTGTPQRSETYAPGKHYLNAMMIAYLPADDPEIAIGITVEYGGYGARTGDLVVDIANAYFAMKDGTLEVDPYVNPALSADPSDDTTGTADTTDTAGAEQDETQPEQGSAD